MENYLIQINTIIYIKNLNNKEKKVMRQYQKKTLKTTQ